MSLNGAFQIGRSALNVSQVALQVAGNNMANAATEGFHRRSIHLTPVQGQQIGTGQFVGRGVMLQEIRREIDVALQARLRDAIAEENAALIDQRFLGSIESTLGELSDNDLSTMLSELFAGFSELSNSPTDTAIRSVVIQQGQSIADHLRRVRGEFNTIRNEIDRTLGDTIDKADAILDQIAVINSQIVVSETSTGQNNSLRDQRDILIDELSQYTEVTVVEHDSGTADILIGSIPVVLGSHSRGLELRATSRQDGVELTVRVKDDGSILQVDSGRIGALMGQREGAVGGVISDLDTFGGQLLHQINLIHTQGQGTHGFENVVGATRVEDVTANLNADAAGLPFEISNGSFFIHLTHQNSGTRTSVRIDVDGDAMSLTDLVNDINAQVANVTASIGPGNTLDLDAVGGYEISFSEDTSGALAVLGVNTFFTGSDATDIAVNQRLLDDPGLIAAGLNHIPGSNENALALVALQDQDVDELGGVSLRSFWQSSVNDLAVKTEAANSAVGSTALVRESLAAQMQATSGVSLDEESINLLTYQRQFQAAARFITVIDETLQILLSLA